MVEENFSWLPFFEELLDIICNKYNPHTLYSEFKKLVPEEQYNDINQMDPLTFIGCICAGNRIAINRAALVKKNFNMKSNPISDINGIPNFVHGTYKYFHEIYKGADISDVMQILWDFARQINENNINEETFNTIVNFNEVKVGKLSQIMYICKPRSFYTCDSTMLSYLYNNIENNYKSFLEIQVYCKTLNTAPYILSVKAWKYSCRRKDFFDYIKKINKPSYDDFISRQILSEKFEKEIFNFSGKRLFDVKNIKDIETLLEKLKNNEDWNKYDKSHGNGIPNAILNTHYKNFINGTEEKILLSAKKYWIYQPGEQGRLWDDVYTNNIIAIGWEELGDLKQYNSEENLAEKIKEIYSKKSNPDKLANWEFANVMNIGDIVYVKKGLKDLIGRGIVQSDYYFDDTRKEYKSVRKIQWTHNGTYSVDFSKLGIKQWVQKTLTDISEDKYKDFCLKIEDIFMNNNQNEQDNITPLNQILYGPPGTGKTYNTVIKSMEIINPNCLEYDERGNVSNYSDVKKEFDKAKDKHQIEFVTFHQSYSYEEFVEGIKPNLEKDSLIYYKPDGIFKKICKNASKNLYKLNNNQKMQQVSFDEVMDSFKEKHPEGSDFENLLNISYEENNLIYHFGMQEQDRKIDLLKMEQLFNLNKQYRTSIDFNNEYGGNVSLKGYYHTFYKELLNIKNALEDENQVAIENNKEYTVDENAPKYVLIIDEINRGNISKIFGELITLIEPDKRKGSQYELKVSLPYSPNDELFGVPKNLYIIGTMNTSDRSIASIDIALRRRFIFKEMMPNVNLVPDIEVFSIKLRKIFTTLNERISILLDRDHQIGHSYFMKLENSSDFNSDFKRVWYDCVMPLLNEYFYGDWEKLCALLGDFQPEGKSFIKKINNVKFANSYSCDEDETYDFVQESEIKFDAALKNAFSPSTKNKNSVEDITTEE